MWTPVQQTNQRMKTTRAQPESVHAQQEMDGIFSIISGSSVYKVLSLIYIFIHAGKQWLFEGIGYGNKTYHVGTLFLWPVWYLVEWFVFRNMFPSLKYSRQKNKMSSVGHVVCVNCKLTFKSLEWSFPLPWCLPWDNTLKNLCWVGPTETNKTSLHPSNLWRKELSRVSLVWRLFWMTTLTYSDSCIQKKTSVVDGCTVYSMYMFVNSCTSMVIVPQQYPNQHCQHRQFTSHLEAVVDVADSTLPIQFCSLALHLPYQRMTITGPHPEDGQISSKLRCLWGWMSLLKILWWIHGFALGLAVFPSNCWRSS